MRLKALVVAAVLAAAGGGGVMAQGHVLKVGIDGTYPPFSSVEKGGRLVGFDVDIANALCAQIKAKCQLVRMPSWYNLIPSIQSGEFDVVVASMSITPERMEKIAFTDRYYTTPVKLVAKKGSGLPGTLDSLAGKRVGVQRETTHDAFLTTKVAGKADLRRFETLDEALRELVAGRLDAVMGDSLALQKGFLASKDGRGFEFVGPEYADPEFFGPGLGIALPKKHEMLRQQLNRALAEIRANGTYKTIASRYFTFDIYGTN